MGKFAKKTKNTNKTTNYEGDVAYKLSPEMELYTCVCTASLAPKFYTADDVSTGRLTRLIKRVKPEFVAKLAIYAREQMYLRSVPLVLLVELAKLGKLTDSTVVRVVQRADEIIELLSYYQIANKRTGTKKLNKLSAAIYWGIKKVFESEKFDEYQFAKYNRPTEITFRDAIFLTHPRPQNTNQKILFEKIIGNHAEDLKTPYTWETELSAKGNTKEVWEQLIDSKKVGYMALLRNLRNILNAGVSAKHIEQVCEYLSSNEAVERSKQLPFRYLSAYREIKEVSSLHCSFVLDSLENAVLHSANNIEGFGLDTNVLLACDVSGSMEQPVSGKSKVQYFDIGIILAMLLKSRCKSVVSGMFGSTWKVIQLPQKQILSNADEFHRREGEVGYSTNGYKVLEWAIAEKKEFDKLMFFTDCQLWDSSRVPTIGHYSKLWTVYKGMYPNAKLYLFDMVGYGKPPLDIRQNNVNLIAGWSDKIFNVLSAIERGEDALTYINSIEE